MEHPVVITSKNQISQYWQGAIDFIQLQKFIMNQELKVSKIIMSQSDWEDIKKFSEG